MAEISRRAEVGSATLYRNFANRRQLLEALYVDEIDAVCEAAATIGGGTPGASLTAWLCRFYAYFTSKRLVAAELLKHSDADDPVFGAGYARVLDAERPRADPAGGTRLALYGERPPWMSSQTRSRSWPAMPSASTASCCCEMPWWRDGSRSRSSAIGSAARTRPELTGTLRR
jgi:AcrR family transcriptional regulator